MKTTDDKLYSLRELRTKWAIRIPNRELLRLLVARRFPMPCEKKGGRWFWRSSDLVLWFGERLRVSMAVQWNITKIMNDPHVGIATTRADHDRAATLVDALRLPAITKE